MFTITSAETRYVYLNNGNWTPVSVLPARIKAANGPRYIIYNKTPDIWIVNDAHIKKYKAPKQKHYPQGKAAGYKGTNPNKASGGGHGKGKGKH